MSWGEARKQTSEENQEARENPRSGIQEMKECVTISKITESKLQQAGLDSGFPFRSTGNWRNE